MRISDWISDGGARLLERSEGEVVKPFFSRSVPRRYDPVTRDSHVRFQLGRLDGAARRDIKVDLRFNRRFVLRPPSPIVHVDVGAYI